MGVGYRGRLGRLSWLLVLVAGVAHAAPLATVSDDVDGDGVADTIELGADGVVHIAGKPFRTNSRRSRPATGAAAEGDQI